MLRKKWIVAIVTVLMACAFMPVFAFAQTDEGQLAAAEQPTVSEQIGNESAESGDPSIGDPNEGDPNEGETSSAEEGSSEVVITEPAPAGDTVATTSHAKAKPTVATVDQPSYELTVVGEEQVPLAGNLLDGNCCVLHLFIIFIAGLILLYYIRDMRKRQARIFELEEELEGFFEE